MAKRRGTLKKIFTVMLFIILIGLIGYNLYLMYRNIDISTNYEATRVSSTENYTETVDETNKESKTVEDMLEEVTKSVVGISRLTSAGGSILGTGIIVSENGYILSNSHVTGEKYGTCYVTIDENTYKGTVVWEDSNLDLSVVKVQMNNLPYVEFGDSKNLKIGKKVYAIGNPIGYEFRKTVTSGIISALNRTIKLDENDSSSYISNLIQTDATINPGNSGGPLIDSDGKVIGINTVKITSAEGIGFAIPINVIKPVVESFKNSGTFEEANIGIYAYDGDIAEYLDLKNKVNRGIYVYKIMENTASSNTDLKEGDLITKIDGNSLSTMNDLREYIYSKKPEDTVKLEIIRGDKTKEINITLGKK